MGHFRLGITLLAFGITFLAGCMRKNDEPVKKGRYGLDCFELVRMTPESQVCQFPDGAPEPRRFDFYILLDNYDNRGRDICEIVHVDDAGKCDYRYPGRSCSGGFARKRAFYQMSKDEVHNLQMVILNAGYFGLARGYDADVNDVPGILVKCTLDRCTKSVSCLAYFPDEIVLIHDYVRQNIIERHAEEFREEKTDYTEEAGRNDLF
jgi:hypothetical protein